jgi:hypothetical protein
MSAQAHLSILHFSYTTTCSRLLCSCTALELPHRATSLLDDASVVSRQPLPQEAGKAKRPGSAPSTTMGRRRPASHSVTLASGPTDGGSRETRAVWLAKVYSSPQASHRLTAAERSKSGAPLHPLVNPPRGKPALGCEHKLARQVHDHFCRRSSSYPDSRDSGGDGQASAM